MAQQKGKIKHYNTDKGYGFIQPDGSGDDVFVHISQVVDEVEVLVHGMEVEYDVEIDERKGKERAVRVHVV